VQKDVAIVARDAYDGTTGYTWSWISWRFCISARPSSIRTSAFPVSGRPSFLRVKCQRPSAIKRNTGAVTGARRSGGRPSFFARCPDDWWDDLRRVDNR